MEYARVPTRWHISEYVVPVAVALLLVACLPLLGIMAFALRTALLIAAPIVVLVIGLSLVRWKSVGEWWNARLSPQTAYRGMHMARDAAFHRGHSWALIDAEVVVGADDIVQSALGPVEEVVVPEPGRRIKRGEPLFRLRHADRMIDLPSPVTGTVLGVNESLREHPEAVNLKPFGAGWVVRMHGEDVAEDRRRLLCGRKAWNWFRDEVDLLLRVLPPDDDAALGDCTGADEMPHVHRRVDDGAWSVVKDALCAVHGSP